MVRALGCGRRQFRVTPGARALATIHLVMHTALVTLFPDLIAPWLEQGVVGKAVQAGHLRVDIVDLRTFGEGSYRQVDDRPFGGGPGMVLMAEPLMRAVESAQQGFDAPAEVVLLTPQGQVFDHGTARSWGEGPRGRILICGRYEGIDQRVIDALAPTWCSLGDFVLSGGELAALAMLDAAARWVPGVLGNALSASQDSFEGDGHLDHPHYTRPALWRGEAVPEVLLSGNHAAVDAWRAEGPLASDPGPATRLTSAEERYAVRRSTCSLAS